MPEVVTRHPDVLRKVLEGAGVQCGPGQPQKILTKCPPSQFCSTPTGELCIYETGQVEQMTQLSREDLCARKSSMGGCSASSDLGTGGALLMLGLALLVPLVRRRRGRHH